MWSYHIQTPCGPCLLSLDLKNTSPLDNLADSNPSTTKKQIKSTTACIKRPKTYDESPFVITSLWLNVRPSKKIQASIKPSIIQIVDSGQKLQPSIKRSKTRQSQLQNQALTLRQLINQIQHELGEYFKGQRQHFSLPLQPAATAWQQKVRQALLKIPYGQVKTYLELATQLGSPQAARAVGQACARNPYHIIVPCHRVVPCRAARCPKHSNQHVKVQRTAHKYTHNYTASHHNDNFTDHQLKVGHYAGGGPYIKAALLQYEMSVYK